MVASSVLVIGNSLRLRGVTPSPSFAATIDDDENDWESDRTENDKRPEGVENAPWIDANAPAPQEQIA